MPLNQKSKNHQSNKPNKKKRNYYTWRLSNNQPIDDSHQTHHHQWVTLHIPSKWGKKRRRSPTTPPRQSIDKRRESRRECLVSRNGQKTWQHEGGDSGERKCVVWSSPTFFVFMRVLGKKSFFREKWSLGRPLFWGERIGF